VANLPEPLRGNELGTFTHHSVAVRLPEIARRVVADNNFDPTATDAVDTLIGDIEHGTIKALTASGPDQSDWDSYVAPHVGLSWLDAPWFFVELYFYRRILDAVGYWDTGQDPFRRQKILGLEQAIAPGRTTISNVDAGYARGVSTDFLLVQLTDAALWGNQVDLSLWPAEDGGAAAMDSHDERLLVDQRPPAIRSLRDRQPPPVDIVLDNAGAELVADLLVADLLLRSDLTSLIRLHAKAYPVFVSDAMPSDVRETMRHLAADTNPHLRNAGDRLATELNIGRLEVITAPFWVSPLEWRARPGSIDEALADSGLVIVKGDANYRRLLGDRHWGFTTPFAEAIGGSPAPLLALRTLKSEVAAGIGADEVARAEATDSKWLVNGRWAMACFSQTQL